jgi:iron complex transport system substrate-binding protein
MKTIVVACAAAAFAISAAAFSSVDDSGRTMNFGRPAARIVTLAPSLTELVFAAGGGAAIVGTSSLSDFPAEALRIPRIGDAARLDVERIIGLEPDLVLFWQQGNLSRELEQLAAAGIRLYRLEPRHLDDVPRAVERLGLIVGHEGEARARAAGLRDRLASLRASHASAAPVSVFYQVWQSPLMTVNGEHLIADVIALCAGRNVFAGLAPLVPTLSMESVVAADPEAILTAGEEGGAAAAWKRDPGNASFAAWRRQPRLTAVAHRWLYVFNGDAISRQGPRIVDGAAAVCAALDQVRSERQGR